MVDRGSVMSCWNWMSWCSVVSRSGMGGCCMVSFWCMVHCVGIWVLKIKWKCVPMSVHVVAMGVSIFVPIFMVGIMSMIMIVVMVKVFVPVLFKLVLWHLIGKELLFSMVLNSVLCSCLNVVEKIIILMLDILDQFLTVVVINIMLIVIVVVTVSIVSMVGSTLCVGMVAPSVVRQGWIMDSMMSGEMSIVLDSVDIVFLIVVWSKLMGVSEVVVSTVAVLTDVVVSIMEAVGMSLVVRRLMVHGWLMVDCIWVCPVVESLAVCILMGRKPVPMALSVIIMASVVGFMLCVIKVSVVLVSSHFRRNLENMVWQIMSQVSIMVVVVVDHMALSMLMVVLVAVVVLAWNVMVLSMLVMVSLVVITKGVVLVSESPSVAVVVGVMLTISMVLVVVVASFVTVDVSWAVLIMMGSGMAIVMSLSEDLVEAMGSVGPSFSMLGVRVMTVVKAFVSPVRCRMSFSEVLINSIVVTSVLAVQVMMEVWIVIVMAVATVVMLTVGVSMIAVPLVLARYIIVLITWAVVLGVGVMMVGGLSTNWGHVCMVVVVSMHVCVGIWLHLEDQITLFDVGLGCPEGSAVGIKCGIVTLVPSVGIKHIEVILPVEIESTSLVVVCVSLDIVEQQVPGHVFSVQALAPRLKGWSPEVHHY